MCQIDVARYSSKATGLGAFGGVRGCSRGLAPNFLGLFCERGLTCANTPEHPFSEGWVRGCSRLLRVRTGAQWRHGSDSIDASVQGAGERERTSSTDVARAPCSSVAFVVDGSRSRCWGGPFNDSVQSGDRRSRIRFASSE